MTTFEQALRHRCRNPKCRMRLPEPVVNPRDAFCTRGCHSSFYRRRCLVCEKPMERRTENQLICGKRKCRNALAAGPNLGRFASPSVNGVSPLENSIKLGIKSGVADDRPWRIVAGELTPSQFHCATVPDGPNCHWTGGEFERIERRNRALLEAHFDRLDAAAVAHDFCADCGRMDDLVDRKPSSPDQSRWLTICRDCLAKREARALRLR